MVINTNKLNLEEQEKLAAVGHFWKAWGNKLLGLVLVAVLCVAAVYGYGWYQGNQSAKAMALYNQVLIDARAADTEKLDASLKALQNGYPGAVPTMQAELLAARVFYEKGLLDKSRAALQAASNRSADKGLQSAAKLHLAGVMIEQKQYDEAIKLLSGNVDPAYAALAADRMADAYALQTKRQEAINAYTKAFDTMDATQPYRQMIAAKLGGFGVDVHTLRASTQATANDKPAQAATTSASATVAPTTASASVSTATASSSDTTTSAASSSAASAALPAASSR